jgi:hypothetical protein
MPAEASFQIQSTLRASPAEVWQHISSMVGVTLELFGGATQERVPLE